MDYRIEYTPKGAIRRAARWTQRMKLSLWAGILLGAALGLQVFFPNWTEDLRLLLLPGKEAVTTLVDDLSSGVHFTEAIETFYQEMINGAD